MIGYPPVVRPSPGREEFAHTFPRVVAGIDFISASLAAARWATSHLARAARTIVSHIVPPPEGAWGDDRFDRAQLRELQRTSPALYGGLAGFAATLKVASVRAIVRIGRASHWLNALVADSNASLLVLGRRSDSKRRGIGEPNVLERCARRSQASVLVVPEGTTEPPRHIVAAIDESAIAERVLSFAHSLARLHACPLTVLHVVAPTLGSYDRALDSSRARGHERTTADVTAGAGAHTTERAAGWLADVSSARGAVADQHIMVRTGDPARETVAAANGFESPLIIVGKRGHDNVPKGSIGSVARELLTRTRMPVLAVEEEKEGVDTSRFRGRFYPTALQAHHPT